MSEYELLTPKRGEASQPKREIVRSYYENGVHKIEYASDLSPGNYITAPLMENPEVIAAEGLKRAALQGVADVISGRVASPHQWTHGNEEEDEYAVAVRQTIFAAARVVRDSSTLRYEPMKDRADMAIVFVEYYGLEATGEDFDERYEGKFYDWEEFAKYHLENVHNDDVPEWVIDGGYFDWDSYASDLESDYTSIQLRHDSDEIFFRDA